MEFECVQWLEIDVDGEEKQKRRENIFYRSWEYRTDNKETMYSPIAGLNVRCSC